MLRYAGRRICVSMLGISLLRVFVGEGVCVAQKSVEISVGGQGNVTLDQLLGGITIPNPRLTVRPHEMATGTRTVQAGQFQLGRMFVYVPQQCVGTQRCPLVLYSNTSRELLAHVADKYGMIASTIDDIIGDASALDQSIKEALGTLAIDPDKIAIVGGSATEAATAAYGAENLDVFSRILLFTQGQSMRDPPVKSPNQMNEYYISGGLLENAPYVRRVQQLRDRGYPVRYTLQFRYAEHQYEEFDFEPHDPQYEDFDFMGHWLQESWAIPDPAARPTPYAFGAPPLLTAKIVAQMVAFWTPFQREPDSIRTTARRAHVREVVVPIGNEHVSVLMADMSALAAHYPSVAAAFKAAGLTPQQHDTYRAALVSAYIVGVTERPELLPPVEETSALAKNVAFIHEYPSDYKALWATGMWHTP